MSKVLYIDPFSGISGDMLLGAFLDAGMPIVTLENNFQKLKLPEPYQLRFQSVMKGAIQAGSFKLEIESDVKKGHSHHHRHMSDIRTIISGSGLPQSIQENALKIFDLLAKTEGKVHSVPPEEVHFHEVGATDSILDIVGICVALDYFEIEEVYSGALPWCEGSVNTQHGQMPLPAPATLALLTLCNAPMRPFSTTMELVTPTGAAFLAAFAKFEKPAMTLVSQGSGAGSKDLDWPNICRIVIGEKTQTNQTEFVVIETNIDDMNPQAYGYLMERCFNAGAVDVTFEPIFMKKNRPATKVAIIAEQSLEEKIANLLLRETTTFGVRVYPIQRYEAERDVVTVSSKWGDIHVKRKWMDGKVVQQVPEYEDCKQIAAENDLPILEVLEAIKQLCLL